MTLSSYIYRGSLIKLVESELHHQTALEVQSDIIPLYFMAWLKSKGFELFAGYLKPMWTSKQPLTQVSTPRNLNIATHKIAVFESEKLSKTFVLVNSVVVGNNAFPICRCLVEAKQIDAFQLRYFQLGRGGITSVAHFAMIFATFATGLVLPGIPNCFIRLNGVGMDMCWRSIAFSRLLMFIYFKIN